MGNCSVQQLVITMLLHGTYRCGSAHTSTHIAEYKKENAQLSPSQNAHNKHQGARMH